MLDHRAGRTWRAIEDTARSVQSLRLMGLRWQSWRRGLDYYPEGELIWLDVDTLIRRQTHGQKSLDDFCRLFYGGPSGAPKVIPYTFDDIVRTLNQVTSYDWEKLLKQRLNATGSHAPLNGIEQGGWRLVYNQNPSVLVDAEEKQGKYLNAFYSLGFLVRGKRRVGRCHTGIARLRRRHRAGDEAGRGKWPALVEARAARCITRVARKRAAY